MKWGRLIGTNSGACVRSRIRWGSRVLMLLGAASLGFGYHGDSGSRSPAQKSRKARQDGQVIVPIAFGEMNSNSNDVYNASGVVALADSRFLFCDNHSGDALFELDLTPDGKKKGLLIRRPLQGLAANAISDLEDMTMAEENGRRFLFVTASLYLRKGKGASAPTVPPSGLLRVNINPQGELTAENMPGFRNWFIKQATGIAASATLAPDDGGLNIEGLAWDNTRHALLFGLRTPVPEGKPLVIPVRVKNLAGTWTTDNLEMLPPIKLSLEGTGGEQGIRCIEYIAPRNSFLVIVGNAISHSQVPFMLYEWDGKQDGKMRRLNVSFAPKMKPEGLTNGTIGGKPVLVFVDDGGGYQVVRLDATLH